MSPWLLDGNVLVALADAGHVHQVPAEDWLAAQTARFATCPITQGTLLRTLLSTWRRSPAGTADVLRRSIADSPRCTRMSEHAALDQLSIRTFA